MIANTVLVNEHNYYNVKIDDDVILVDGADIGNMHITLPINGVQTGKMFYIKNIRSTGAKTIIAMSSDSVYFDNNFPTIELPGYSSCSVIYYNNCYNVLHVQSI
jgi:hypothetical protein